jgi:hypothetical protein
LGCRLTTWKQVFGCERERTNLKKKGHFLRNSYSVIFSQRNFFFFYFVGIVRTKDFQMKPNKAWNKVVEGSNFFSPFYIYPLYIIT